ncbi:MAG: redox-sensing transcriptional repressor Rex [Eubacteriales bacterium]|nr:redox-sensing transcriptional repressor Rex [Eubacteriales bacterium]MDD3199669.1 redox-sensing transcriptional repressor Rex [Eubacteriales bacterium]MDD4629810.1 redox-sensing transcriptional repressor Rex [Eubacteriales bacterium]
MKNNMKISSAVIKRLPRYRRYLMELQKKNVDRISSNELSSLIGYTASQIRQDLNNFGGFGQQGYGYNINSLYKEISAILGLDQEYGMVIVGTGNLGQAIANYTHYYKSGFKVCAMFDVNPKLIGLRINDIEVLDYEDLDEYLKNNQTDIGIVCTNMSSAQEVVDKLCNGGVEGIWNFAPTDLIVKDGVALEDVHLSDSLHSLAYYINRNRQNQD